MSHSHSHDHGHDHSHVPTVTSANQRKILISFVLIFTFMIVEAVGGVISGSLALLADAGHMLTDAMALALAYMAFRFGSRAADSKRTFGYLRFEVLAGFINAVTLFAIVAWIVYEAWGRLQAPPVILAGPMMIVAVLGLLINLLVLWIMTRGDTEHVNVKGAILHVIGDLLGSVGAILAAVIIYLTGWTPIDPILSVLVAALILRSAWKLLAKSIHILLEGAPEDASCGNSPPVAPWPRYTCDPMWTRKREPWSSASRRCFESNSASNTPRSGSTGTRKPTRTSAACNPGRTVMPTAAMTTVGTTMTTPLLVTSIEAVQAGSQFT